MINKSRSKVNNSPRPSQVEHIPWGLLKLNICGVGGVKLIPQPAHEYCEEKTRSVVPPAVGAFFFRDDDLRRFDFLPSSSSDSSVSSDGVSAVSWSGASSPSICRTNVPLPILRAASTDSDSLPRILGPAVNRSTTTSTLWRLVRSRLTSPESRTTSPSTRARVYPRLSRSVNRSRCSPF